MVMMMSIMKKTCSRRMVTEERLWENETESSYLKRGIEQLRRGVVLCARKTLHDLICESIELSTVDVPSHKYLSIELSVYSV